MSQITVKINKDLMKEDKKISIAIMSSFAVLIVQYLILIFFNLTNTPMGGNIQLASKAAVGIIYLLALPVVLKRHKIQFIGIYFISIFIFALNILFFNENWPYLKDIIFPFFFSCLPSLIYSYSINDWNILKDVMRKTSLVVFLVGSIIGVLVFTIKASIGAYSMALSYYMLLPSIVYLDEFLEKFTLKSIFISTVSLFVILALGSRGAVLCIGVFMILKLIIMGRKLNYKTILLYLLIIIILLTLCFFLDTILEGLYNILLRFGIQSRSILLFLRDDVYLSGREHFYKGALEEIAANPIFGIGLAGDRRILGGYVHNILLEMLASFGVILGSILFAVIILICFKGLLSKNKNISSFIAIWFSLGFVPLTVSGSYVTAINFWILLGFALKSLFGKKKTTDSLSKP